MHRTSSCIKSQSSNCFGKFSIKVSIYPGVEVGTLSGLNCTRDKEDIVSCTM